MDDQTPQVGAAIPAGATIGDTSQASPATPAPAPAGPKVGDAIPQGATVGDASDNSGGILNTLDKVPILGTSARIIHGAAQAGASTIAGGAHLVNKLDNAIGGGAHQIPTQALDQFSNNNGQERTTEEKVGYGGETLMEFLMGDEALKGLSLADKLLQSGKIAKTLQASPKLMNALKVGAEALNTGTRMGAVQATQTGLRTGDVHQAAKEGLEAGVTGGVLGGGASLLGDVVGGKIGQVLGKATEAQGELQGAARTAKTSEELKNAIGDQLDTAKEDLHKSYDSGINELKDRIGDTTIEPVKSPLEAKAQEILGDNPDPNEHPDTAAAREAAGEGLKPKIKSLIEQLANKPEEVEAEAPKSPESIIGTAGNNATAAEAEPVTKEPYNINDLVQLRQKIRAAAQNFETGDINSRVLVGKGGLLNAVDDTIQKLADSAGDPDVGSDYKDLRANYANKINAFNEPVIKALRDGKPDDAARAFLTGTKQGYNVNVLQRTLGEKGTQEFAKEVFSTMLKETSDANGTVNPAQFLEQAKKLQNGIKTGFFNLDDASNGLDKLYKDANSAAQIQRLARYGLLSAAAPVSGHLLAGHGVLGALLGLTVAEGGGYFKTARELLDHAANHPKMWEAYKAVSPVIKTATAAGTTVGKAAITGGVDAANQAARQNLGDTTPPKSKGSGQAATPRDPFMVDTKPQGLVEKGNIPIWNRPTVQNADGSHSSEYSTSMVDEDDPRHPEVLIPTVVGGKFLTSDGKKPPEGRHEGDKYIPSPEEKVMFKKAWKNYKDTGYNLGKFDTWQNADKYAAKLHNRGNP